MAMSPSSLPESTVTEESLLDRLLSLYEEERELYSQVLQLSREQGEAVRQGGSMASVRRILEQKKGCLDLIGRLELTEHRTKVAWEKGRHGWSAPGRRKLHDAVQEVACLIEDILVAEEKNDLLLIEQTRVV
ncbi:MAG: flagellar export chaperone FlgN [Candidatus Krumholzibacteriota bacterium]